MANHQFLLIHIEAAIKVAPVAAPSSTIITILFSISYSSLLELRYNDLRRLISSIFENLNNIFKIIGNKVKNPLFNKKTI